MSKSFTQLIEDVRRTYGNSHVLLIMASEPWGGGRTGATHQYIPLNPAMIKRVFGQRSARAFHVTSPRNVKDFLAIQKSRKAISTAQRMTPQTMFRGVEGGGGVVFLVRGNLIVSALDDLFTITDKNGRRWTSVGNFFNVMPKEAQPIRSKIDAEILRLKEKLFKKYEELYEHLPEDRKPTDFNKLCLGIFFNIDHLNPRQKKIVSKLIEDYINGTEKVIFSHAKELETVFFSGVHGIGRTNYSVDEWVMDNFEVEKIYFPYDGSGGITVSDVHDFLDNIKMHVPTRYYDLVEAVNVRELIKVKPNEKMPKGLTMQELENMLNEMKAKKAGER